MFKPTAFRFLLLGGAACALVSCTEQATVFSDMERRGGTPVELGSSESLLAAEGDWNIVEEEADAVDPSNLHQQAKKRVDPTSMGKKTFIPETKIAMANKGDSDEDVNYRLLRVERNIRSLQQDFKKLLPPLSNLIVADRNLDNTIEEIQANNAVQPASGAQPQALTMQQKKVAMTQPRAALAPKRAPAPVSASVSAPAPAPAGVRAVKSLRLGEHPGRTRIVLDITGPAKFKSDVDNNERLLLIELPETGWSAAASKKLKHPLIAGYSAQPGPNGGTMLALELKKNAKVTGGSALPPNPTYNNHRVFVDVAPL